jgi:hypothetical protein
MTDGLTLRLKYLCGRYWRLLVPVLVLLSAIAFAGAAAGVTSDAQPQQTTVETDSMTVETTLSTEATVTGNTTLYEQNDTLTNLPVYLRSATPEMRLIAVTTTPPDRTVSVTQQIVLRLSATRNGEVFWRDSRVLAADSTNVTNGSTQTTATLDVQRLARERLAEVRAETGNVGTVRVEVETIAVYQTDAYSGRTSAATPVRVTERAYELETPQRDQQTNVTTEQQIAAGGAGGAGPLSVSNGPALRDLGAGLGGFVALGLAALVWLTSRRIGDFDTFRQRYERVRYAEWISRGSVPATGRHARVPVETLVDLVDIAIDSEKRVIYDVSKGVYAVVDENLMYEFRENNDGDMNEFGFVPITEPTESGSTEKTSSDDGAETAAAADSWFDADTEPPDHDSDASPDGGS